MIELESFSVKGTERIIPEVNKMLSETLVKPAKVLNFFSSQFFSFLNLALLGSPGKISAKLFNN
jgi:hypothetical protein